MNPRPTAVRWQILALLMGLCFISHFNRASMSVAANDRIMGDYGISPTRMGTIYSAFLLVYSLCMVPGGAFIDRFGARRALLVVGFGSAIFGGLTGLTGWLFPASAAGLWLSLVAVRGGMGMLSAPLHPASARAAGSWFPPPQRSLANGLVTGAAIAGVAASYPGFGALIQWIGWPAAFLTAATATGLLSLLWKVHSADTPREHPRANAAEAAWVQEPAGENLRGPEQRAGTDWRRLLAHRSLLLITLSYAAVGYFQYLFVYWMQYYFDKILHLGEPESRRYASIPQLAMALTMPMGGWLADCLSRRLGVRAGRGLISGTGMVLSAAFLLAGVLAKDPIWIVTWFTLALGAMGASEGPFWATAVDIGGRSGGAASALCNTGGNPGGLIAPVLTPWVSERWGWPWGISLGGIICFLGAACWCGIDPRSAGTNTRHDPSTAPPTS